MAKGKSPSGPVPGLDLNPRRKTETTIFAQQTVSGPLPSARELEGYELVSPGAANRIITMAEGNQARRHESERMNDESNRLIAQANAEAVFASARSSDAEIAEVKRSQWMAYSIVLLFLGCSVGLALVGKEIAASVLGGGVLVALVTTFLKRKPKA